MLPAPAQSPALSSLSPVSELLALVRADAGGFFSHGHREIFVARSPGRLDVMGGIADYTGALVCEMPLDVAAAVAVQRRDDRKLTLKTYNSELSREASPSETANLMELSLDDFYGTAALLPTEALQALFTGAHHWAAYLAGAFPILARNKNITRRTSGANIACFSNVPLGGGVSSSAAIECAALAALTAAYHLLIEPLETAVLAQKIENLIVGAPCGIMDQVTSVLGKRDQLLLLHCQPHDVRGYVPIPPGLTFLGINSNVKHSVGGSAYRHTRVSAFMARAIIARMYKDLGIRKKATEDVGGESGGVLEGGYLANIRPAIYQKYLRPVLPEQIDGMAFLETYGETADRVTRVEPDARYTPRAAADHHVLENARVEAFVAELRTALANSAPDTPARASRNAAIIRAGTLMLESHRSYGENAHLGCSETDLLVELVMQRGPEKGFYGAKITGGGSGGTVAVLADTAAVARGDVTEICTEYQRRTGLAPLVLAGSSPGSAETGAMKVPLPPKK